MKSKELKQHSVDWLYEQIFELRKGIYPPYQRKDRIWPLEDNQLLIDSILRDYDIQKFYFRVISNDEFEVVDGQQRLKALFSYKCNRFRLPISIEDIDGDSIANCRLCDLEETFQNKFKDTLLDICWLYDYTDIEAANFFQRLQKGVPLVPAEKRHAMIDSNMRNIVTELTKKNEVFKVCDFNNKRFEHEDAIAKILYLHLNGRPTALGHVPMERAYEKYKYLTNDDIAIVELNKALNFVKVAFNNKLKKLNRNGLITLSYLYTILSENYNLNNSKASEFAQSYIDIDDERIYNKEKPVKMQDQEFMKYDLDMRYNSKIHLEGRYEFLEERFIKSMSLIRKDKKRFLNNEAKNLVKRRDRNVCQECGANCEKVPWASDHIVAHTNGGATSIKNSQLLCRECNSRKGNK